MRLSDGGRALFHVGGSLLSPWWLPFGVDVLFRLLWCFLRTSSSLSALRCLLQVEREAAFCCQRLQDSSLPHLHSPLQWLHTLVLHSWEFRLSSVQGLSEDAVDLFIFPDTAAHWPPAAPYLGGRAPALTHASSRQGHFCLHQYLGEGLRLFWKLDTWRAASSLRSSAWVKASDVPGVVSLAGAGGWHSIACYRPSCTLTHTLQQSFYPLSVGCALALAVA